MPSHLLQVAGFKLQVSFGRMRPVMPNLQPATCNLQLRPAHA
jgi:hypothetical protein